MAREALRFLPLLKACRADSAGVERVPCVSADAGPQVVLARRPAAERAPDARPGGIKVFVVLQFRLKNRGGRAIAVGHAGYYVRKAFLGQTSSQTEPQGEAGRGVDKGDEFAVGGASPDGIGSQVALPIALIQQSVLQA